MPAIRTSLIAGGSALVLALSLVSCGGQPQDAGTTYVVEEPTPTEEPVEVSQDANVNPEDINPGWVADSESNIGGTSDLWYPASYDGEGEGLYFTNAGNDAGLDVTFVDDDGNEDNVWDLEVVNGHLQTKADASDKRQVDITFQDDFTCYDAVSGISYNRGTAEQYQILFEGQRFVEDAQNPDDYMIEFSYDDNTFTRTSGDDVIGGTWEVKAAYVAELHYVTDTSSWDDEVRILFDDEGNVAELDEGASTNLVVYLD